MRSQKRRGEGKVLTPFFWKNWSKRDKEEQSMKNRVQSAD
jgi:hypothetical protein